MIRSFFFSLLLVLLVTACAEQPHLSQTAPATLEKPSLEKPTLEQPTVQQSTVQQPIIFTDLERETEPQTSLKVSAEETPASLHSESLWPRIQQGMQLTHHSHPRLDKQLKWYATNHSYVDRVLERGGRYLYYITSRLEEENMPLELALLPVVESAFDPFAYSHSHAAGLWQFIPGTGKRFGLDKNWWYDGRRDPVASTEAAIKYLQYLHDYFDGDWLLALAAYNSGEGNVRRAINRNKKLGKATDFWSLKLPSETEAYVPKLLAVAALVSSPEQYSTNLPEISNRPYFDSIEIKEQADLAGLARLAGIDSDEIYRLNAGYNRWVTQPNGPQRILLPVDAMDAFKKNFASTPSSEWVAIKQYVVKPGDNLSVIAQQNGITVTQLKQRNHLTNNLLKVGQRLQLPGTGLSRQSSGKTTSYVVAAGDSLWKISRQQKVSLNDLVKWNNLDTTSPLKPGQTLTLGAGRNAALSAKKVRYKVRQGDSLSRIASKFDLKINQIVRWNKLNPGRYLQPGQRLTLFVDITNI